MDTYYDSDLFVYDLAGVTTTQITWHRPGEAFVTADYSPDGTRLAVTWLDRASSRNKVLIMNSDGTEQERKNLDWADSDDWGPTWSRDGQFILFSSNHGNSSGLYDMWVMRPDGSGRVKLTDTQEHENGPFVMQPLPRDAESPVIQCPPDIVVGTDLGQCSAVVHFDVSATDDSGSVTVVCDPPSGSVFSKGSTTVNSTATDATGNTATCSFTVTVQDFEPPTISCPPDLTVNTGPGQCSAANVNLGAATTADNCCVASVVNDAPTVFPKGITSVTWTASDTSGNTATCVQRVTVQDREAPSIACPADIALGCSIDLLVPALFTVSAYDNCDAQPAVICNPASGSGFPVGVTTVTATATDEAGNTSTCTFKVTRAPLGFNGFLPPIGGADETGGTFAEPLRTFKLGSTIPAKFSASCSGAPVTTGIHRLQMVKYSDATNSEDPIDASPQETATSGNQFRLADGQWHFNLDTRASGMTKGIWQLVATLSDGSQHWAWIQVK